MAGIKDYSSTASNNTTVGGVSVAEGMLPSNINNTFRGLAGEIREWYNDSQWVIYGDGDGTHTAAYASSTSFTIASANVTSIYSAGRRIKAVASTPGTIVGTIASSSFSTNTTVNVTWDSGNLSNEAVVIYLAALTTDSIPTGIDAARINTGVVSNAEFNYLNGVTSAVQTQLDAKQATITGSATTIDTESLTASRALISNGSQKVAVSDVTDTELGYLDGVSSAIQTQINSKQATITGAATTIDDANLTASRAVVSNGSGKVAVSDVTSTELGYLDGVSSAIQTQLDAKQATITGSATTIDTESLTANRAVISNGSQKIAVSDVTSTELGYLDGVSSAIQTQIDTKAATSYVNDAVAGLRTRVVVEAASTGNLDLTSDLQNGDTVDGVTLATGDQVLLKDQSTASQNGVYTVVSSGTAGRSTEYDSIDELSGQMVIANQGSANDNKFFLCTTNNTASLGSDSISFSQVTPQNNGTVTSVGLADGGASEFTIGSTPVTSSGNITITVNSIADTKLGTIGTANKVSLTALNIDGGADIGADLTTSDLIAVDDGANGTNRKAALSRVITLVQANIDDPTALAIALG